MKTIEKDNQKNCFVITPIGKEGSEQYNSFKEILDFIIKPALEKNSIGFNVIRADDINKTGSFLKGILENISLSYLVIVDMTNQNPNVFYELGIRHALSNRTILVAQSIDDIPSDLREYRTVLYDTSAKGAALFSDTISKIIKEIEKDPEHPDNPVQIYLPHSIAQKVKEYEETIESLKRELSNCLKGKEKQIDISGKKISIPSLTKRLQRIFELKNAEYQTSFINSMTTFTKKSKNGESISYSIPTKQGNFNLYYIMDNENIKEFWYLTKMNNTSEIKEQFADLRILLEKCSREQPFEASIIISTNEDFTPEYENINKHFVKLLGFIPSKERKKFKLIIWDKNGLDLLELKLGIVIDFESET